MKDRVNTGPNFKAIQLIPTRGKRLMRTNILKISCPAMKSAATAFNKTFTKNVVIDVQI